MILSHTNKYVFIKNKKVAGTSMELFLSRFSNPNDIVTLIGEDTEFIPSALRPLFNRDQRFQNYTGMFNHMSGVIVRDNIGKEIWGSYFTFCFERSPLSKLQSMYQYKTSDMNEQGDTISDFMDMAYPDYTSDAYRYFSNGKVIVDKVADFTRISDEFAAICSRIGISFNGDMGFRTKGHNKKVNLEISEDTRQDIANAYALEADLLPFMTIQDTPPNSPAALPWCKGRAARENGRLSEAEVEIEKARKLDSDFLPALREQARLDWRLGRKEEAIKKIEGVIKKAPERVRFWRDAAIFHRALGNHNEAENYFLSAIERSPKSPRLSSEYARMLASIGKPSDAIIMMNKSLDMLREGTPAWVQGYVRVMCWEGRHDDALKFIHDNLADSKDLEEYAIPDGQISFKKERELLKAVGVSQIEGGLLAAAAKTLVDVKFVMEDGGLCFLPLIRAMAQLGNNTAHDTILAEMLDLEPVHFRFFSVAILYIRKSSNTELAARFITEARKNCSDKGPLMEKVERIESKLRRQRNA